MKYHFSLIKLRLSPHQMASKNAFYELHPNKLGKLVTGIQLSKPVSAECVRQIVDDVKEHRILVFKNQVRSIT